GIATEIIHHGYVPSPADMSGNSGPSVLECKSSGSRCRPNRPFDVQRGGNARADVRFPAFARGGIAASFMSNLVRSLGALGARSSQFGHRTFVLPSRFRHQHEREQETGGGPSGHAEKGAAAAAMVADIAGERGAERGAEPDRGADDALRQIEMAGAARGVGNDQRNH